MIHSGVFQPFFQSQNIFLYLKNHAEHQEKN